MAELKVGLAPNKTSYYDDLTNTYLTLSNPKAVIQYDEKDIPGTVERLRKITHALYAAHPALVLYEGKLPKECIEDFKAKYKSQFYSPITKKVVENGKVIGEVPVKEVLGSGVDYDGREIEPNRAFDRVEKDEKEEEVTGLSVGEAKVVEEVQEEKKKAKKEEKESAKKEEQEEVKEEKKETKKKTTRKSTAKKSDKE